jgi:phytoene dehydrogenase-like protein
VSRLFRGLRHRPPRPRYDVVVIGAGVGGLVCANLLARAGLAVLLVEQHYMVGGYCSTFRRGGYVFDASTHFYPLLGNPATLTGRLLAELGCRTRWIKMDPVDTFHFPDGSRFEVPADLPTYRARLERDFPHEAAALETFFAEVRQAYLLGLLEYFRGRPTAQLERHRDQTLRQVLDRHFRDPKLKLLLTADCPHWGSPPCRVSFVFDAMLRLSYFLGNYYPAGGSQAFADDLARCLEAHGGDILTSTRADRIAVEDGRAAAVELETLRGPWRGRRRVAAGAVVSNADLLATLQGMLEPDEVPPEALAAARRLRPSFPCFLTHLGLEGVPAEELERAQGYYWDSWDPDEMGRGGLRCKVFAPTLYEPGMAPPGAQVVILQKVLEMDWSEVGDWTAHKRAVEEYLLRQLENLLPGVSARIAVRLSASARTAHRFTLNTAGAMLGWEMSPDQLGEARPDVEGPVPGLYFVGHWTRPGGGITPVMVSAQRVAAAITGEQPLAAAARAS